MPTFHTVAKQRRQEALKFFQNFDFIVENDLLGKFASMKALLSELAKLQKPKAEAAEGDDEAKSDSGPSTEGETQSETALPTSWLQCRPLTLPLRQCFGVMPTASPSKTCFLLCKSNSPFSTARQPNGCLTFSRSETMAKRGQIVDLGRHKPLGSSWRSVDTAGYSRVYEPETRPEFRCYVTGQQAAMQQAY